MIRAGIVGGTGYTGVELVRLLAAHPGVELRVITSRSEAGVAVATLFPNLRGRVDLRFVKPEDAALDECSLVFFATPNGTAMHSAAALLEAGVRIIDLSADFRLRDASEWARWYGMPHACPGLLQEAVYGLPELNRAAIARARLLANPGCYPTATLLGLLPLIETGQVQGQTVIVDAKSGVSGAGREAKVSSLYCEAGDSLGAYGVSGHRHLPEIRQVMRVAAPRGSTLDLVFVPHLAPMIRGIHATLYAQPRETSLDLQQLYEQRYAREPFVDVLPRGAYPQTRSVRGSNFCRIAVAQPDPAHVVVMSVIDNLVKGAAGQAVQNMNIMFGLPESTGLDATAVMP